MVQIKFGIEIENCFNSLTTGFQIAGYHSENFGENFDYWSVTRDSSLNVTGIPYSWKEHADVAELVSQVAYGKEELLNFIQELQDKYPGKELKDVFYFNTSCGAHLHFSTWKEKEKQMTTMVNYRKLRTNVFKRINEELPHIFPKFKKQYFRGYAKEQKEDFINKLERLEFNYTDLSKGIEWRSFNLMGVTTWDELKKMVTIATEELENILDIYEKSNSEETITIDITENDIAEARQKIMNLLKEAGINV